MFETSAEVLTGLKKAYSDYEEKKSRLGPADANCTADLRRLRWAREARTFLS